jgi:hypothetical protein
MKDTFDLTKFLKENKSLENLNSTFKSLNENQYYKDAEADDAEHIDALEKDMKDDKKSSMEAKIREMILAELGNSDKKVNEYDSEIPAYDNSSPYGSEYEMNRYRGEMANIGIETDSEGKPTTNNSNNELEEAKKDEEEVEDVEVEDTETEEAPAEEAPATSGGLEDIAADMEGTEGDLMDALMKSLKIAKGMGNEKLETQIGNTLKFFVSEYIGGEEQ